jgi:hypothetical protein
MLRESFERAKRVQATTAWGHSSAAIITLDHLPAESSAQWCQGSANRPILRQNPERRPRTGQPTVCKRDKTAGREMSGEFLDLCWWHDIDNRIQPTRHNKLSPLFSSLLFSSFLSHSRLKAASCRVATPADPASAAGWPATKEQHRATSGLQRPSIRCREDQYQGGRLPHAPARRSSAERFCPSLGSMQA